MFFFILYIDYAIILAWVVIVEVNYNMQKKKHDIMLSVIIISYNQEKYIKEAIESVLEQKTSYKFEVLLADDCSSDGTGKICEEYAKEYPEIIRNIKRDKNLGATQNILDAGSFSNGKYITVLEGDDYWIDKNKIQMQIDFLEKNKDYVGISHLQEGRDLKGNFLGNFPANIKEDTDFSINDLENGKNYSCSTCLYKNIYKNKKYLKDIKYLFSLHSIVGDLQLMFYLTTIGKIYVINKPMMVYRVIKRKGESNYNSNYSVLEINYTNINILKSIDEYSEYRYNFFKRYSNYVAVGFIMSLLNRKFSYFKKFVSICPKKYRFKSIMLIPYNVINLLRDRLRRK